MSVRKEVPPVVVNVDNSARTKPNIGPLVVMSGFLTRKNRMFNRWKQRWWQLLDNGMLFYYKNDNRGKLLGQIDVAHTCYDVKVGKENCRIPFPRVAPSCCCFSFTVLKRSYYLYAPTAAEAKKWAESIRDMSRVLNRRVVAGVERRKAPDPPGPLRPPSCPPNMRIIRNSIHAHTLSTSESMDDSCEMSLQLPNMRRGLAVKSKLVSSMPDLLDRAGYSPSPIAMNNDRLWLDGSPYPVSSTTFQRIFPSPPTSYSDDMFTSMEFQEPSVSLVSSPRSVSSPTSASPHVKKNKYFRLGQGATAFQHQQISETGWNVGTSDALGHTKNSAPNEEYNPCPYRRNSTGTGEVRVYHRRRIPSRSVAKNRCSLPIIFEHTPDRQEQMQSHRPASCIPNPLSSSAIKSNSIPHTKHNVSFTTRVPVYPRAVLGDLQKKRLNGNLAAVEQTQPQPLPRNRIRAHTVSNHLDSQNTANRPVPKPRRSKLDESQLPGLERTMSCDFIASNTIAHVLQATSPTESERSVSLTTSRVLTRANSNDGTATKVHMVSPRRKAPPPPGGSVVAPPRPKRDSGPPTFIPPPPPLEELDSIRSTCSSVSPPP